jgi:hypothetical protein
MISTTTLVPEVARLQGYQAGIVVINSSDQVGRIFHIFADGRVLLRNLDPEHRPFVSSLHSLTREQTAQPGETLVNKGIRDLARDCDGKIKYQFSDGRIAYWVQKGANYSFHVTKRIYAPSNLRPSLCAGTVVSPSAMVLESGLLWAKPSLKIQDEDEVKKFTLRKSWYKDLENLIKIARFSDLDICVVNELLPEAGAEKKSAFSQVFKLVFPTIVGQTAEQALAEDDNSNEDGNDADEESADNLYADMEAGQAGGVVDDSLNCCICLSKAKSVLLLPCRHLATCDLCAKDARMTSCPLCRQLVTQKIPVFL